MWTQTMFWVQSASGLIFGIRNCHSHSIFLACSFGLTAAEPHLRRIREKIPAVRTVMVGNASAVEVLSAIRAVAAGEAAGPPRVSAPLFRGAAQQPAIRQNLQVRSGIGRSQSEQQLVELTRWGLTNKEIASRLNPSEHTLKNHVHRILRKTKDIRSNRDRGTLPPGKWLIPLQPTHCIVKRCLELKPPKPADDHAADRRT